MQIFYNMLMNKIPSYTKTSIITALSDFKEIFDVARLVNVSMTHQLEVNPEKTDLIETNYDCYAVWNKGHRCENCVSAKAFMTKGKMTKFEFIDNDIYYVVAKYIEVDDKPYMLELVTKIDDDALLGAYGQAEFVNTIISYNRTLYIDSLTQAYNRSYYDSQLVGLSGAQAIAMLDIDHFKTVNDTYGHNAGDLILKEVVATLMDNLRSSDSVIRYGGDEFIILFEKMKDGMLEEKLNQLRKAVAGLSFEAYPDLSTSLSIGGMYCKICNEATVKAVDKLLYKAKQHRNTVCVS